MLTDEIPIIINLMSGSRAVTLAKERAGKRCRAGVVVAEIRARRKECKNSSVKNKESLAARLASACGALDDLLSWNLPKSVVDRSPYEKREPREVKSFD